MINRENLKIELDKEENARGVEIVMLLSEESKMKTKRLRISREKRDR